MHEFRAKLAANGRILLPAAARKLLEISTGDEIVILIDDGEAKLFSLEHAILNAQAKVKKYNKQNKSLSEELISDRRKEANNE